jgi:eukaryotic-like serine/threonine-protein kinase
MALKTGDRLGTYEILDEIGAGGMGQVYRARDTKLDRDVALKLLPEVFASDPDRLMRFTREAKTLAALNHPNIAQIYGLEKTSGVFSGGLDPEKTPDVFSSALVMELVEGEDLSERIARGAVPLDEALPIARQIAEALEAAHEAGIIHRDLKPANIKVREDGTVKVLDFGLAKAIQGDGVQGAGSGQGAGAGSRHQDPAPTMTSPAMTAMGLIIGTAAYMSPEQAKGKSVDRRADIWAFGVVLYEMLTGQQAFAGDSMTEILGAVVLKEPDWSALPAGTPARLRDLLARCLEKDPRKRRRDIGDVKLDLDAIAAGDSLVEPAVAPVVPATRRPTLPVLAGGALVVAAIGMAIGWALPRGRGTAPAAPTRFIVSGPDGESPIAPQVTPDGRTLVFSAKNQLYKRDLDTFEAVAMPGTDGAIMPLISPDGHWVAFFANGKIRKVSLSGGDPTTIAEAAANIPGAAWGPDNTIMFSRSWATGLSSVSAAGGEIRQLTEPDRAQGERGHWQPHPLPSGHIIFTILTTGTGVNDSRVGILDPKTGQRRVLFPGSYAQYLQSGHILYSHAGAWHLIPFDPTTEQTTGDPISVLDDALGVSPDGGTGWHPISVSDNGVLAYAPGPVYRQMEMVWADRAGKMESLGLPPHTTASAALSPDGRRIAVTRVEGGTFELWTDDIARKTEDRLDIKGSNAYAYWNSTSDAIAFISIRKGEFDAYTARADGSNVQAVATKDYDEEPFSWTHDGRLIEKEWRPDGSTPLLLLDPRPNGTAKELVANTASDTFVALSPDDRWMLYSSARSGRTEMYLHPVREGGTSIRASNNGGVSPLWSPNGSEIYFQRDRDLVSVSFRDDGGRPVLGSEPTLFQMPASSALYGITPDGRRFLVGRPSEPAPVPGIRVVLNWFDELKASGAGK